MVLTRIGLGDGFFDFFGVALPLGGGGGGMREDLSAGRSGWDRPGLAVGADIFFSWLAGTLGMVAGWCLLFLESSGFLAGGLGEDREDWDEDWVLLAAAGGLGSEVVGRISFFSASFDARVFRKSSLSSFMLNRVLGVGLGPLGRERG